jgi:formamidopyrimidine-DNA glycosylase
MPELPEVETVLRGLAPALVGRRIVAAEARRPDLRFPLPERFAERLIGATVQSLTRRAKYLLMTLSSGEVVVMHLGMTGRFSIIERGRSVTPGDYAFLSGGDVAHDHVVLDTDQGARVVYNDPRRFGFMLMSGARDCATHPILRDLGVEPLGPDWTADYAARRGRGRKSNLKSFLMDQKILAGLGNIYVSEALYSARLSPNRSAGSLADRNGRPTTRAERLVPAVREVLTRAIEAGGSTLRDYRAADGARGGFQNAFAVYDRAGERCVRTGCGGYVKKVVHSGRATYYCGACQT